LVAEAVASPTPGPQDVVLRVSCCGVCRTDLHVVKGNLPKRRLPLIPGHEIVGTVAECGKDVRDFAIGDRVGVAWLHRTCGSCPFCSSDRENLCERPDFTGWTVDGGYAEFVRVPAAFGYQLPTGLPDDQAAPLLCAGIIGYRSLRLSGV
jgi:propanol-preferring alcohol dehydrogenase